MIIQTEQRLVYRYDHEELWIEPWGPSALRVRATKGPEMPLEDWALLPAQQSADVSISVAEEGASIVNGKIRAELTKDGKLTFYNQHNQVLLEEYVRNRKDYKHKPGVKPKSFASALNIKAREFKPILGGDYSLTVRFESVPNEKIYGMGQYQQPYLNLKGCELELAHRNSQASVPFMVSSLGYGFLWNNPAVGRVTFGKNITTWEVKYTKYLDYWICAGDTPSEIVETYGQATGTVPMMPEYGLGFWQSKLRYQTQEELLEVAREYKRRNLPISVIVIDFFHWTMQGEWRFDPEYWPDPQAMVDELKEMGIELMVSIWPTVDHKSENYQEMVEKGLLIRTDRGHPIAMNFHGNTIHIDVTNPEAREYFWNKAKENYYDYGIRIFWLDEAEPEYTYYDFDLYRYHLGPNVQIGNVYPLMYAKAFYDGMRAEGQENIVNLVRCAWAAVSARLSLSGDIHSSFESCAVRLLQVSTWAWLEFLGGPLTSAVSAALRMIRNSRGVCQVVPVRNILPGNAAPWGQGTAFRTPGHQRWRYLHSGAPTRCELGGSIRDCVKYLHLRERLKPYIREQMEAAHRRGTMIEAFVLRLPRDKQAWEVRGSVYVRSRHLGGSSPLCWG